MSASDAKDDQRCAGRFWWRARLRPSITGTAITKSKAQWIANNLVASIRDGSDSVTRIARRGEELGDPETADDIAACLAYQDYADDHPELSVREVLGLPKEEPVPAPVVEPAKPMTREEIAAGIRALPAMISPAYKRLTDIIERLASAVEALPVPAPVESAPVEPAPSPTTPRTRDEIANRLRSAAVALHPYSPLIRDLEAIARGIESLILPVGESVPVKVSSFAAEVAECLTNHRVFTPKPFGEPIDVLMKIELRSGALKLRLLDTIACQGSTVTQHDFVALAATCQRAAEDLDLIGKE